jgi:hypothetical protein
MTSNENIVESGRRASSCAMAQWMVDDLLVIAYGAEE